MCVHSDNIVIYIKKKFACFKTYSTFFSIFLKREHTNYKENMNFFHEIAFLLSK